MAFKKSIIPSKRFVIASTLGCVAISFPLFLVACSNASSSSADETNETAEDYMFTLEELEEMGVPIFESADDLKKEKCGEENEYESVYVKADSSFYLCYDNKWNDDWADNLSIEIGTVESSDDLGECGEENDGEMFRVPRDTIYDTYACEDGEWVSDFGGDSGEPVDPKTVVKGTFKDERNGKTYKTVKIGKQTWMAENLNYKVSNSYCYEGKAENCKKYGRLYRFDVVKEACPDGWKVPTKKSWEILLATTLDFYTETTPDSIKVRNPFAAIKFESFMGLNNDPYGFKILPTGRRLDGDGYKDADKSRAFFWTSTAYFNRPLYISFISKNSGMLAYPGNFNMGLAIRCIKK
ncbi:hypothetical protein IKQ19_20910 [Candidatus Saccharibacteria bacterium]|nr:hypothetical protein [Candidatus Saccharibacteria bacterium]